MSDLTDFGGGVQPPEPPRIQKKRKVPLSVGEKRVIAGWYGPCPEREARAYVTKRDPERHKIHALDAYGISEKVLHRLGGVGASVILVHESDSDTVLEFSMRQYKHADDVPDQYLMREDDPQRYVPRGEAEFWSHGAELYVPRDEKIMYD